MHGPGMLASGCMSDIMHKKSLLVNFLLFQRLYGFSPVPHRLAGFHEYLKVVEFC